MIKGNENGVTLMALVILIIVFILILSITINIGISTVKESSDNKIETDLSSVQQAIMQQYIILKTSRENGKNAEIISNDTKQEDDSSRPSALIGTRLSSTALLVTNGFGDYISEYQNQANMTYEDYYYYLDNDDLEALKIDLGTSTSSENEREYIVKYSTGEVYDITNEKYYKRESEDPLYLEGASSNIEDKSYNFTDE